MENRIQDLENTLSALVGHMRANQATISIVLNKVDGNFEKITNHLNKIESDLQELTKIVESLRGNTDKGFGDVHVKLDDLKTEITKINDVTGYDDLYTNLRAVK